MHAYLCTQSLHQAEHQSHAESIECFIQGLCCYPGLSESQLRSNDALLLYAPHPGHASVMSSRRVDSAHAWHDAAIRTHHVALTTDDDLSQTRTALLRPIKCSNAAPVMDWSRVYVG